MDSILVLIKVIQNIKNIELFYGKTQPRLRQISGGDGMSAEPKTLYDKIWEAHEVGRRSDGNSLLYIDLQLLHEVTSPQAFEGLQLAGRPLW